MEATLQMATFTSAKALSAYQRARAAKVKRSLEIEHGSLVEQAKQDALKLTSGSVSTKQLRRMGHPFSRRRPQAFPRLPINKQTGELQRSLRVFRRFDARGLTYQLQFTSPHAIVTRPYGTAVMVARGFWAELRKRHTQRAKRRMIAAFRRAHK